VTEKIDSIYQDPKNKFKAIPPDNAIVPFILRKIRYNVISQSERTKITKIRRKKVDQQILLKLMKCICWKGRF